MTTANPTAAALTVSDIVNEGLRHMAWNDGFRAGSLIGFVIGFGVIIGILALTHKEHGLDPAAQGSAMTVRELIAALKALPQDLEVVTRYDGTINRIAPPGVLTSGELEPLGLEAGAVDDPEGPWIEV